MEPKTLSASAASVFETCEARYKASYIDRTPEIAGNAGSLGSCVHECLELWVNTGQHLVEWPDIIAREKAMLVVYNMTYYDYFSDTTFFADGWSMLRKWLQQMDWSGREVISTEEKKSFDIPTSRGPLQFNYIVDRLDMLDDGSIDVVDYKSVRQPIQADRMKHLIQPRSYALAAMIEYGGEKGIWVTYDLLRYSPVSVKFDRDDCVATWNYLKKLAERIYASDGSQETLNPECRFCPRKQVCETLKRNVDNGGVLSIGTIEEVTDQLALLQAARAGLDAAIDEIMEIGLKMAEDGDLYEWETEVNIGKVTAKGRRNVDSERAAKVLGGELMMKYGSINVGTLETIIKDEPSLSDSDRSVLKQMLAKKVYGTPYIEVMPKTPFSEES